MVGEYLAYLCQHDGPGDTAQESHRIWAHSSIFSPNFDQPKGLFEILCLPGPCQLKDHPVVFTTQERSSTLFIFNRVDELQTDNPFNVSGDGLGFELTETDINVDFLIVEGDNGDFSSFPDWESGYLGVGLDILGQNLKEMGFPVDEVGDNTNQIDITAVWAEV